MDSSSSGWGLDSLGNWNSLQKNPNTSGLFQVQEDREHNRANELKVLDGDGAGSGRPGLDLNYDKAGNLREEEAGTGSTKLIYTHDAWNRLVKVEYEDSHQQLSTRGEYSYNGLNWRIRRKADTDTDGTLDQERLMYYSANWQLLEEDVDDDLDQTVDRHVQYIWGARYIDDIVMRREDRNNDDDYLDPEDIERYYLTDVQFSVVAILDEAAQVIERVSYSPYGEARHHRMSDLNGDGMSTSADMTIMQNNDGNFGAGDLDRDGTVEYSSGSGDDWQIANDDAGLALSAGLLSYADEDNIIGYCGYLFNRETRHYHVRFRCYSPQLGRWLERDPKGYVDGMNRYQYVTSDPVRFLDPVGLDGGPGARGWEHSYEGVPNGIEHRAWLAGCKTVQDYLRKLGIDDGGAGDDWDYPGEPNLGFWYKKTWLHATIQQTIILVVVLLILVFTWRYWYALAIAGCAVVVGSLVSARIADKYVFTAGSMLSGPLAAYLLVAFWSGAILMAGGLALGLRTLSNRLVSNQRSSVAQCQSCGYAREGLGPGAHCPECGTAFESCPQG